MIDERYGNIEYICYVSTILTQNLVEPSTGYKSLLLRGKSPNINEIYSFFYAESNGCIFVFVQCIKQKI